MKNEHLLIKKAELTDDEQAYVDGRQYLATARAEWASQSAGEPDAGQDDGADDDDTDDDLDEAAVSVEEWVVTATRAEIIVELKERNIDFAPNGKKDDLAKLLVDAVAAAE